MSDEQTMPEVIYAVEASHMASDCRWSRVPMVHSTSYLRNDRGDDGVVVNGNTLIDPVRFANAQRQIATLAAEKEALLTQLLEAQGVNAGLREIKDDLTAEREQVRELVRELVEAVDELGHSYAIYLIAKSKHGHTAELEGEVKDAIGRAYDLTAQLTETQDD